MPVFYFFLSLSNDTHKCMHIDNVCINTLMPRQNGRFFPDDIFKCIFLNENLWIPIKISMKFVPKGQIKNIPALFQTMAWRRPGDKPLSETMMVTLLTHICFTRPQWVNTMHLKSAISFLCVIINTRPLRSCCHQVCEANLACLWSFDRMVWVLTIFLHKVIPYKMEARLQRISKGAPSVIVKFSH